MTVTRDDSADSAALDQTRQRIRVLKAGSVQMGGACREGRMVKRQH